MTGVGQMTSIRIAGALAALLFATVGAGAAELPDLAAAP